MLSFSSHDVTINIQALFLTQTDNNPALWEFAKLICVNMYTLYKTALILSKPVSIDNYN